MEVTINFDEPFEITEIFRIQVPIQGEKKDGPSFLQDEEEDDPSHFIQTLMTTKFRHEEYSMKTAILWESIRSIKQYCYPDTDWKHLKGEKYWISLDHGNDILVLGSYYTMLEYWRAFRKLINSQPNGMDQA